MVENADRRVRELTGEILAREDFRKGEERWRHLYYRKGAERFPSLLIEDFSGIPYISDIPGIEWYQLRSRVRGYSGDFYLATHDEIRSPEEYNRNFLGLGDTTCVTVRKAGHPFFIARGCAEDPEAFSLLKAAVKKKGGNAPASVYGRL
ncbi:MAG: hypothetical protein FJ088_01405 [Deltaproteobacteria bacterium]|nr:hypothetical protein [Deltaproteobacteria bacterium]